MKALLTNFHQSPRKVRLVADMIRGKGVPQARALLTFQPQKSTGALLKLLDSAVANARQMGASPDELIVKTITVDKGLAMRRFAPRARGRAAQFRKTSSIIAIELGAAGEGKGKKSKAAKSAAAAPAETTEKPAAKKAAKKAVKKAAKKTAKAE